VDAGAEFATFVRMNTPALFRSAYLLTRSRTAAEDLVQDTFVRLYPKWSRVVEADVPMAYVRRAMVNNYLNSQRGARGHELLLADPPDRGGAPDPALLVTEQDFARRLLERLPARSRVVLVLRFFEDLTDAEIAADLGCRQATVRSIVSRALATLRQETERGSADAAAQVNGMNS
jgi:RNA polymerase sigma-70 factor (sigma-E family)